MIKARWKEGWLIIGDYEETTPEDHEVHLMAKVLVKSYEESCPCFVYHHIHRDESGIAHVLNFEFSEEEALKLPDIGYEEWEKFYFEWKKEQYEKGFEWKYKQPIKDVVQMVLKYTDEIVTKKVKEEMALEFLKRKNIEEQDIVAIMKRSFQNEEKTS